MTGCRTCGAALGKGNKQGYCKDHRGDALRRYYSDPIAKERAREVMRRNATTEYAKQRRSEAAKRIKLHEIGKQSLTPEVLARRAKAQSDAKLAWCPRELRAEYKRLTRSKKLPTCEARAIILDQHERDMETFRRKIMGAQG